MKKNIMKILLSLMASTMILSSCSDSLEGEEKPDASNLENHFSSSEVEESSEGGLEALGTPQLEEPKEGMPIVTMKTSLGNIKIVLYPENAPLAVENFLTHAKNGYYDGQTFHRVISGFMIQGGDPTASGSGGESIWGEDFEDEVRNGIYNVRGTLSMANSGVNTNGSQFFIVSATTSPLTAAQLIERGWPEAIANYYEENGGTPQLDAPGESNNGHTAFGFVIEGMDIVDAISNVETIDPSNGNDKPIEDVIIESIEISKA